ncbi:uncharacterized protein M6B38_417995 [Iris pallida]|nr:uncharacterized protein M6B38_417995 [Iris pallida]
MRGGLAVAGGDGSEGYRAVKRADRRTEAENGRGLSPGGWALKEEVGHGGLDGGWFAGVWCRRAEHRLGL